VKDDGLHWCRGEPKDPQAWKCVKHGQPFNSYRRSSDTQKHNAAPRRESGMARDWMPEAKLYASALTASSKQELACLLGLPIHAIDAIPLIGWAPDHTIGGKPAPCWTIPEVDPTGRVVGIMRRFPEPVSIGGRKPTNKALMAGGARGLTVPHGLLERTGTILIPEGASDVLALVCAGIAAVGRPSNIGGAEMIARLLPDLPVGREIIVLGENDQKPDGHWPGKESRRVAEMLSALLNRPIKFAFPHERFKDAREWLVWLTSPKGGKIKDFSKCGRAIIDYLTTHSETVVPGVTKPSSTDAPHTGELMVESLAGVRPKPVRYLVPGRIPAGMLGLFAGEGGHGKSMTTLALAAAVTSGRCAFGLSYPDPPMGKVLLVSCEDDWERTITPRLASLGADLSRVLRIRGVNMKSDGKTLDFHLGHFRELQRLLVSDASIRLVVIDPAGAYIGRAGVNEHKDADLRGVLGPLSEMANATGVTVLLVKHLNKSADLSAVQRVSGSAGYVNAVRFAYLFGPDPKDPERKYMLPIKANVLPAGQSGLAYSLVSIPPEEAELMIVQKWPDLPADDVAQLAKQMFRQEWEDGVQVDANEVARGGTKPEAKSRVDQCAEFLRDFLQSYAYPSDEILAACKKAGFTFDNVKKAKTRLRAEGLQHSNQGRFQGVWWSGFGTVDSWTLRPSDPMPDTPDIPDTPHSPDIE